MCAAFKDVGGVKCQVTPASIFEMIERVFIF